MSRVHSPSRWARSFSSSDCSPTVFEPRIDPRKPVCRLCETMTSVYWRVPARNVLLCNNCFVNDCRTVNRFCKLKRLDSNMEVLPTFDARFHLSTQLSKDEQVVSSSSSSSSSMITKTKRPKTSEPVKSQLTIKISTRQQPSFRSSRKTMAFKSKKVRDLDWPSHRSSIDWCCSFAARKMFITIDDLQTIRCSLLESKRISLWRDVEHVFVCLFA